MYHYHHRYPLESDQKDLFISELKAENFELRHRKGFWYDISQKIASTEHEIALVNGDRRQIEDDMAARKVEDDIIISNIRADNDELRGRVAAKDAEIDDLKAQIAALRKEDEHLTIDLGNINSDIDAVEKHNADLRLDIPKLEADLHDEWVIGRNLRMDIDKAKAAHSSILRTISHLEDQLAKNKLNEVDLRKILDDRTLELGSKNARLKSLEDEIGHLRLDIDDRDKEVYDLNRKYGLQLDINNKERHELDRQLARNADLDLTVKRLEEELIILEKDISFLRTDVDRLRIVLSDADAANRGLEEELDALNRHAQLLESQNVDLTKELDAILVSDDRMRADLDRRHRVAALQSKNDEEMRHSINRLSYTRSISPVRSISRSPVRRF